MRKIRTGTSKTDTNEIDTKCKGDLMDKLKQNYEEILELVFKISYLCLAFATFISIIYISPIQPILVKLTLVLGLFVILVRIINWKKYRKMPCLILMIFFCLSFLLSTFMNRQYGMTDNLKWILWTGIQFFALYVCDLDRDTEKYRKEFNILSHLMIIVTSVSAVTSLVMMVQSYSEYLTTPEGEFIVTGYTWDRLWGVYTDPNYGAVFSVIGFILAVLFIFQQKGIKKLFYVIAALLNLGYVTYSDSRTGEIAFVLCGGFLLYFCLIHRKSENKKYRYVKNLLIVLCIMIVSVGGMQVLKTENTRYQTEMANKTAQKTTKPQTTISTKTKKGNKIQTARHENIEKDATNGRISLWKSAVEVWQTSPIYGAGYSTFISYAKEHVPETYAVNNEVGDYTSMHNAFFNTLAFQGILGFVLFLLITFRIIQYVLLPVFKKSDSDSLYLIAILAVAGTVLISMLLLLDGIYTNSPSAFALWVFSGYLVQYSYQVRREEKG